MVAGHDADGDGGVVGLLGEVDVDGLHGTLVAHTDAPHLVAKQSALLTGKHALLARADFVDLVGGLHVDAQAIVALRQVVDDLRDGGRLHLAVPHAEDVFPVGGYGVADGAGGGGVDAPPPGL